MRVPRRAALEPIVYDFVQQALGAGASRRRVERILGRLSPGSVLDVGAGTGAYASAVPASAEYLAVDVDEAKLERLRSKYPGRATMRADATSLPLPDGSFDVALCIAVAHHLPDAGLDRMLAELARVVAGSLVFLEPVPDRSLVSRGLWRIDQGTFPRDESALLIALRRRFSILSTETYRIAHRYVLCVATPLRNRGGDTGR
jgi:SAM-dependent methyltransferase